jgi:glyoxylase-like metal-dependent hydrolase (beta-lactamase superfamily II)
MLLVVFLRICLAAAQDEHPSKFQMKVSRLAANLYMIEGAGGNIGASVGDDGIVMIDDEVEPLVEQTLAALRGITDKPVRFVINTHYHDDHTGGNAYFHTLAPIIAHDNVRKRLESGGISGNGGSMHNEVMPAPTDALPAVTFEHEVTLHLNGEHIRVVHFPAAHTDGDAIVFFPSANVVHMGDIFVTYGFPFIDIPSGGSIDGMIDAVEKVIAQVPPDVRIIPGHGSMSTLDDLRSYLGMLKGARNMVAKALREGNTLDQMRRAKTLDPWKKYSGDFVSEDAFLETLYNSLRSKK